MSLRTALHDPARFLFLYGTTPPRADAPEERVHRAASRLAARIRELALDGLVVYDVQDESGRTSEPRPFPFLPTMKSQAYARLLHGMTSQPIITYKSVSGMEEGLWRQWLAEAWSEYGIRYLSLVGRATSRKNTGGISLSHALQMAHLLPTAPTLGGVVIPERHRPENSESARLLQKAELGCEYFISQAVYDPEAAIRLLRDYARDCREAAVTPQRIILTFTPCGCPETLHFMKWLGISVPPEAERRILTSNAPLAESVALCAANFRQVLAAPGVRDVPLGVNVESVSIRKEEIAASVDLYHALRAVVA